MLSRSFLLAAALTATGAHAAPDAETAAWWRTTGVLAGDAMEGRDTGSPGHARAASYVAERFRKAGLRPAGDGGGYRQTVPLEEIALPKENVQIRVVRPEGTRELRFLYDVGVAPAANLPATLDAPIAFRGRCTAEDFTDVRGKAVVCYGARGALPPGRAQAAARAGAAALVQVDHGFVEPANWPMAYARTVTIRGGPAGDPPLPMIRLADTALAALIEGSGQDAARLLAAGASGAALPSFEGPGRLQAAFRTTTRRYTSDNVLGLLPGTDPTLANQPILLIAHLDGYGYGEPVKGDRLYNGALDDAAYVATLIGFAERRAGKGLRRPVLIAAVTGEEKGLLGSRWLAARPTAAAPRPAAVLNLDQLRPLYPLTVLTTLALDDTTLGDAARKLAGEMGIEVRPDREPERNLMRRTDHWPFVEKGVPGISFIFGVDPGTEAERRYRDWYLNRYHRPADDMGTPIDFDAAGKFNRFYYQLAERVADAPERPAWKAGSPYAPK